MSAIFRQVGHATFWEAIKSLGFIHEFKLKENRNETFILFAFAYWPCGLRGE